MIRQNDTRNRYEFDVDGGEALAFYRLADGVMTFTHTEVPAPLRGRGLGSQMMRAVLQDVRAQGLKVVPRSSRTISAAIRSSPICWHSAPARASLQRTESRNREAPGGISRYTRARSRSRSA